MYRYSMNKNKRKWIDYTRKSGWSITQKVYDDNPNRCRVIGCKNDYVDSTNNLFCKEHQS